MMLDCFQSELQHLHACMTINRISPAELAAKELPSSLNTEHTAGIICFEVFDYDYAQMLCTLGIPLLFVDTPVMEMRPPLQADRLYMENRIEIQNMMAQMAQRGRKRIAFAGDKEHCQSFHERYLAYKDAAEHFGMATDWPTCATQKAQPNYSEYLYQSLRGCPTMPDAFICANDFIAMDLINALHRLGYSVPDDIWICGFDDSQEASYFSPRLTSIHIHGQIMGYAAANLLMTRIEEPSLNYRTVYTETNLTCVNPQEIERYSMRDLWDKPWFSVLTKLTYSAYLNILWLICSLPIFTIGASTTALFYCTLKMAEDRDEGLTRMFFRAFRSNFKPATKLWLILLALGCFLGVDGFVLSRLWNTSAFWTILTAPGDRCCRAVRHCTALRISPAGTF